MAYGKDLAPKKNKPKPRPKAEDIREKKDRFEESMYLCSIHQSSPVHVIIIGLVTEQPCSEYSLGV